MHATLPTHVLALAPDSLASLGRIDPDGLAELWAVFTRCKDSLQNGHRLENLSWRLWFDSGRRGPEPENPALKGSSGQPNLVPEEWSDPEWEETSSSDSSGGASSGEEEDDAAVGGSSGGEGSKMPARPRTTSVPAAAGDPTGASEDPNGTSGRPSLARRGFSREGRPLHVISGNSLQRMIADLQRMPEIPPFGKARSLSDMPAANVPVKPPLGSRGSSAPDGLNSGSRYASAPTSPTQPSSELDHEPSPLRSRRTSSDVSPALSRANTSPAPTKPVTAGPTDPPAAAPALHRRFPSNLAMSAIPPSRRSRPATPAHSPPSREGAPDVPLTPSETAMLAVADSRNRSDVNLSRRTQSAADLAASYKPASFVKGFEPSPTTLAKPSSSTGAPASVDARPGPGAIAPPPTPQDHSATLAPSPPRKPTVSLSPPPPSRTSSRTPASSLASPPAKMPPAPSTSAVSAAHSQKAHASPGPSAMRHGRRNGGPANKKIFFISSPDSDEEHSSRSRSSGMKVVVTPPTATRDAAEQAARASEAKQSAPADKANGADGQADGDEDDWASDSDDDDSSGWGSDYSTEDEDARAASRKPGKAQTFDAKTAFAKRAPSDLQRTASTATVNGRDWGGGPGELKRPGLLSQLFHPDQFVEEDEQSPPSMDALRRKHQSSPALATLGRQPSQASNGVAEQHRPQAGRTKSFLKGKPDHVELESSSEEEEDEEGAAEAASRAEAGAQRAASIAQARRQRELEEIVAPPQTPRTTRRAMLATELSESLRRNLLWERQTRNRVLGGQPRRPMMPGEQLPPRPASSTNLAQQGQAAAPAPPPGVMRSQTDNPAGARAHEPVAPPAPPSRRSSPTDSTSQRKANGDAPPPKRSAGTAALPRRHTTGTGLYLQAMSGGRFPNSGRGRDDPAESELSESSDDDGGTASPADAFGSSMGGQRVW
ncbi:hypothetical protein JCM8202v2_001982 [Rhodotorula sphaerocarpa]